MPLIRSSLGDYRNFSNRWELRLEKGVATLVPEGSAPIPFPIPAMTPEEQDRFASAVSHTLLHAEQTGSVIHVTSLIHLADGILLRAAPLPKVVEGLSVLIPMESSLSGEGGALIARKELPADMHLLLTDKEDPPREFMPVPLMKKGDRRVVFRTELLYGRDDGRESAVSLTLLPAVPSVLPSDIRMAGAVLVCVPAAAIAAVHSGLTFWDRSLAVQVLPPNSLGRTVSIYQSPPRVLIYAKTR